VREGYVSGFEEGTARGTDVALEMKTEEIEGEEFLECPGISIGKETREYDAGKVDVSVLSPATSVAMEQS